MSCFARIAKTCLSFVVSAWCRSWRSCELWWTGFGLIPHCLCPAGSVWRTSTLTSSSSNAGESLRRCLSLWHQSRVRRITFRAKVCHVGILKFTFVISFVFNLKIKLWSWLAGWWLASHFLKLLLDNKNTLCLWGSIFLKVHWKYLYMYHYSTYLHFYKPPP